MTFNGIKLEDLGIIVQSVRGILDMPQREGETMYDWGNKYEALVSEDDIFFGTRRIQVDVFFDARKADYRTTMETLDAMREIATLETDYGDFEVALEEVRIRRIYNEGRTLRMTFLEINPDLSGGLPTVTGDDGIRLDGHDLFVQFGLVVEEVKMLEIQRLKSSQDTSFRQNGLSVFREPQQLEVKVHGNYASKSEMSAKIQSLNALLAKPGMRHFSYKGDGFQCYITEGHTADIRGTLVTINLKLRVMAYYDIEQIVKEVVDRITLMERPQSDLMETDPEDPAFVRGKDQFVSQDSQKLDGKSANYYARESEIKNLRDADLAAEMENEVDF